MSRYAERKDATQAGIVRFLEQCGATVCVLRAVEAGVPDLLVGWSRDNYLVECKAEDGKLNTAQIVWHNNWNGRRPVVIRSVDEAQRWIEGLGRGQC